MIFPCPYPSCNYQTDNRETLRTHCKEYHNYTLIYSDEDQLIAIQRFIDTLFFGFIIIFIINFLF